ncbi:MAG: DEAD/DEAH box helicase [Burkholderiales bacterium]
MFDADTVNLMSRAPVLSGLDIAELPQRITNAYAAIVAARIRLREPEEIGVIPEAVSVIVSEMKRLAFTLEAFVSVISEQENRASAAFVAGAAHHVSLLAKKLQIVEPEPRPSYLEFQAISPDVSATLLFLIAEASADAAELAKSIVVPTGITVEAALLTAIKFLASGQLRQLINVQCPPPEQFLATDLTNQAVQTLYHLLFQGTRAMALAMLGITQGAESSIGETPEALFNRVKSLCIESISNIFDDENIPYYSLYPGPLHLASLLASVGADLTSSALVNISPPSLIDADEWSSVMNEIAERRPYLWRNHRQAIVAGYLEPGTSAAVSFPTGAGKSTLAELKIATTTLLGLKTVFLAPTLSLVDQTVRALAATFPRNEVQRELVEELSVNIGDEGLSTITVMTPERCLAMLSFDNSIFNDIGLIVFDECHLMHPRDVDRSRRAIDAMLCLLNLTRIAPNADLLLLSAMMENTEEISGWVQSLTSRPCLALELTWKPTRQVRGCVVYGSTEINTLNHRLREARSESTNKHVPASVKRELVVQPYGFFSLRQTWQSSARSNYALLQLLNDTVQLGTGIAQDGGWYLTPNGNQVASAIAEATARQKLKTLVFTQTIPLANSATQDLSNRLGPPACVLTEVERHLFEIAIDEAGGRNHIYLEVDADGNLISSCACHHGLLLPVERQLHESLYKRPGGINVLVATSTLAQGMNLPSEVVIIGGDRRFNPGENRMEQLEAHELLNAAGRAGRAGEASYGFVLIVPSKVVHFNNETSIIHRYWTDLQAIFAQSDQCLVIDDPMEALLDHINNSATELSPMDKYFIGRLPIVEQANESESDAPARVLLSRTFAAYRARVRGDQVWIDTRIDAAIAARHADPETPVILTWADRLAAAAGIPIAVIRDLGDALATQSLNNDALMIDWRNWMMDWLRQHPHFIPALIRRESLEGLFGTVYKSLELDEERGQYVHPYLVRLLDGWMVGDSLSEIELIFGTSDHRIGKCENAREFVLRIVPELTYIFGLPAQVIRANTPENGEAAEPSLALSILASCIREGIDNIEKLALTNIPNEKVNRRAIHRKFSLIEPYLSPASPSDSFADTINRVKEAVMIASLF